MCTVSEIRLLNLLLLPLIECVFFFYCFSKKMTLPNGIVWTNMWPDLRLRNQPQNEKLSTTVNHPFQWLQVIFHFLQTSRSFFTYSYLYTSARMFMFLQSLHVSSTVSMTFAHVDREENKQTKKELKRIMKKTSFSTFNQIILLVNF